MVNENNHHNFVYRLWTAIFSSVIIISVVLSYYFLNDRHWIRYGFIIYLIPLFLALLGYFLFTRQWKKKGNLTDKMVEYRSMKTMIISTSISVWAFFPPFAMCGIINPNILSCSFGSTVALFGVIMIIAFLAIPLTGTIILFYRKKKLNISIKLYDFELIAELNLPFFYFGGFCLAMFYLNNLGILISAAVCLIIFFIAIPLYAMIKKIITKATLITAIVSAVVILISFFISVYYNTIPNLYYYILTINIVMLGLFGYIFYQKEGNPILNKNNNSICVFRGIVIFEIVNLILFLWLGFQDAFLFFALIIILIGFLIYSLINSSKIWKNNQNS